MERARSQVTKGCFQAKGNSHNETAGRLDVSQRKYALSIIRRQSLQTKSGKHAEYRSGHEKGEDMNRVGRVYFGRGQPFDLIWGTVYGGQRARAGHCTVASDDRSNIAVTFGWISHVCLICLVTHWDRARVRWRRVAHGRRRRRSQTRLQHIYWSCDLSIITAAQRRDNSKVYHHLHHHPPAQVMSNMESQCIPIHNPHVQV